MSRRPLFRRQFIVDRALQFELLFRSGFYAVFMLIVLGAGVFYPIIREIDGGDESTGAASAMLYMHRHFWPIAILCVVLTMVLSVHTSHRIAGPMYRMRMVFRMLERGTLPRPTVTRNRDYLKADIACLNSATDALGEAMERVLVASRELSETVSLCNDLGVASADEQLRYALAEAKQQAETLQASVGHFQVEGAENAAESAIESQPAPEPAQV